MTMRHDVKWNDPVFKLAIKMLTRQQYLIGLNTLYSVSDYLSGSYNKLNRSGFMKLYVNNEDSRIYFDTDDDGEHYIMIKFIFERSGNFVLAKLMFDIDHSYEDYSLMIISQKEKMVLTDEMKKPVDKTGSSINTSVKNTKRL